MYRLGIKNDFKENHKFQDVQYVIDRDIDLPSAVINHIIKPYGK